MLIVIIILLVLAGLAVCCWGLACAFLAQSDPYADLMTDEDRAELNAIRFGPYQE